MKQRNATSALREFSRPGNKGRPESPDTANTRDAGVELARILACLIVVGCHVYHPFAVDGVLDPGRVFIGMCCADGVTVFWLILGFFLFRQADFRKLCRRTVSRILVPVFVFSALVFFFFPLVSGSAGSLAQSVCRPRAEWIDAFGALARWKPVDNAGHLWFLYVYVLVVLSFPALSGIVGSLEKNAASGKWILFAVFLVLADNSLVGNQLMFFSYRTVGALFPSAVVVVIGHFLYKRKDLLAKHGFFAPLAFLAANGIRTVLYMKGFRTVVNWYSLSGLVCSVCVVSFSLWLASFAENRKVRMCVCTVASFVFPVYLVHPYAIRLLRRLRCDDAVWSLFSGLASFPAELLYTLTMILAAFFPSLVLAVAFRAMSTFAKRSVARLRPASGSR